MRSTGRLYLTLKKHAERRGGFSGKSFITALEISQHYEGKGERRKSISRKPSATLLNKGRGIIIERTGGSDVHLREPSRRGSRVTSSIKHISRKKRERKGSKL